MATWQTQDVWFTYYQSVQVYFNHRALMGSLGQFMPVVFHQSNATTYLLSQLLNYLFQDHKNFLKRSSCWNRAFAESKFGSTAVVTSAYYKIVVSLLPTCILIPSISGFLRIEIAKVSMTKRKRYGEREGQPVSHLLGWNNLSGDDLKTQPSVLW